MTLKDWSADSDIPKQDNTSGVVDNASLVNKEWGMYLYYNIVNHIGQKDFTFYYNDDSSLVSAWFPDFIWDRVTITSSCRLDNISSSSIRKAIVDGDKDYVKECVPYLQGGLLHNMIAKYKEVLKKEV